MRWLVLLWLVVLSGAAAADGGTLTPALLDELRRGGLLIYFRHADTPNYEDPEPGALENCATQRNLSKVGREMARNIGLAFRELEIPIGIVRASPYCRCLDTARLAFGRVESDAWLRLSGDDNDPEELKRRQLLQRLARIKPLPGTNTIFVGHGSGPTALGAGGHAAEGEAAVVRPTGEGYVYLGSIRPDGWVKP